MHEAHGRHSEGGTGFPADCLRSSVQLSTDTARTTVLRCPSCSGVHSRVCTAGANLCKSFLAVKKVETTWELEVRKLSGESLMLAVHSGMPASRPQ